MKALLDENLSPRIAEMLHGRGHDVVAVVERAELAGGSDRRVVEAAALEQRAVITDAIKDFRPLVAERLARGQGHGGLILLPAVRTRTRAAVAAIVEAVSTIMGEHPDGPDSSERWAGPLQP